MKLVNAMDRLERDINQVCTHPRPDCSDVENGDVMMTTTRRKRMVEERRMMEERWAMADSASARDPFWLSSPVSVISLVSKRI